MPIYALVSMSLCSLLQQIVHPCNICCVVNAFFCLLVWKKREFDSDLMGHMELMRLRCPMKITGNLGRTVGAILL